MSRRYLFPLLLVCMIASAFGGWWLSERPQHNAGYPIVRVAVSRTGRFLAVGTQSGWIGIIDRMQPDSPQRFRIGQGKLRDLRFSADEEWVYIQNDVTMRHSVFTMGLMEDANPGDGEPQRAAARPAAVPANVVTSNIVPGAEPGTVVFGNFAGSVEIRDSQGKLREQHTFR